MFVQANKVGTDIEVGVERVVGTITINGTKYTRYVKVIELNPFTAPTTSAGTSVNTPHNITGMVGVLSVSGIITNNTNYYLPLPYFNPTSAAGQETTILATATNITVAYTYNWSGWTGIGIIEYYK